jgi:hypothetical protein
LLEPAYQNEIKMHLQRTWNFVDTVEDSNPFMTIKQNSPGADYAKSKLQNLLNKR